MADFVKLTAHFDGLCKKNPGGHASWSFVILEDGREIATNSGYIGGKTTQPTACYRAAVECLRYLNDYGKRDSHKLLRRKLRCDVICSNQIIIDQLKGDAEARSDNIRDVHATAMGLLATIPMPTRLIGAKGDRNARLKQILNEVINAAIEDQEAADLAAEAEQYDAGVTT